MAAVTDKVSWETARTVPAEQPSVWLQTSHSASSLPPCCFNYRASASSTSKRCLRGAYILGSLVLQQESTASTHSPSPPQTWLPYNNEVGDTRHPGLGNNQSCVQCFLSCSVHWWRSWAQTWGLRVTYSLSTVTDGLCLVIMSEQCCMAFCNKWKPINCWRKSIVLYQSAYH